jgi:hypothetical protein
LHEEAQNKGEEQIRKLKEVIEIGTTGRMGNWLTELAMRKKRYGCIGIGDLFNTNQMT